MAVVALVGGYLSFVGSSSADAPDPPGSAVAAEVEAAAGTAGGSSAGRPDSGPGARGYRVPDEAAYAREKAAANARTADGTGGGAAADEEPLAVKSVNRNWQGISRAGNAPSDSTGAIGTTRYIELTNGGYAIYNRTSDAPLSEGSLNDLANEPGRVFDPQVIWDPTTNRFYYVADSVISSTDHRLAFGYSTTASPNSAANFCHYVVLYGSRFPDYPKLGDTTNLLVIGANSFAGTGGPYLGSDLVGITKPPSGTTCVSANSFTVSIETDIRDTEGDLVFTPVPANQMDGSTTGYAVASDRGDGTSIEVYTLTKDATTGFIVVGPARSMLVSSFSLPADAAQPGTTKRLDTLDARLTQAVSAIDPARGSSGAVAVWTQHTVAGGAGAEVRWYEINPVPTLPSPYQSGRQTDGALYNYNAAIAPDRRSNTSGGKAFGSKHLLFFNTSSTSEFVDIRAIFRAGTSGVGDSTLLRDSTSRLDDFSCSATACRWGDYSAATPDPASDVDGSSGAVWGTNAFTDNSTAGTGADWRTQNFSVSPK